jgi:hypothetical protein
LFPDGLGQKISGQDIEHWWQLSQNIPMIIGMHFSNYSLNEVENFTVYRYTGKSKFDKAPVATFDIVPRRKEAGK